MGARRDVGVVMRGLGFRDYLGGLRRVQAVLRVDQERADGDDAIAPLGYGERLRCGGPL